MLQQGYDYLVGCRRLSSRPAHALPHETWVVRTPSFQTGERRMGALATTAYAGKCDSKLEFVHRKWRVRLRRHQ